MTGLSSNESAALAFANDHPLLGIPSDVGENRPLPDPDDTVSQQSSARLRRMLHEMVWTWSPENFWASMRSVANHLKDYDVTAAKTVRQTRGYRSLSHQKQLLANRIRKQIQETKGGAVPTQEEVEHELHESMDPEMSITRQIEAALASQRASECKSIASII